MSYKLSSAQLVKMYAMIEDNVIYSIIGERFGVSVAVVHYHAKKIGHRRQVDCGGNRKGRGRKRLLNQAEIMSLIKKGKLSDRAIALVARCSKSTVTNYRTQWRKEKAN